MLGKPESDKGRAGKCAGAPQLGERHTRYGNICACSGLSTVRFATGPKRSMEHLLGLEKNNFLIRDIDGPKGSGAPVESC